MENKTSHQGYVRFVIDYRNKDEFHVLHYDHFYKYFLSDGVIDQDVIEWDLQNDPSSIIGETVSQKITEPGIYEIIADYRCGGGYNYEGEYDFYSWLMNEQIHKCNEDQAQVWKELYLNYDVDHVQPSNGILE